MRGGHILAWKISTDRPAYIQIIEEIKQRIISGYYQPGEKIKSVRDLAEEAKVNPNTMQKALARLESQNLIISQGTTGKTITTDKELIEKTREDFAMQTVKDFIDKMDKIGYSSEDVIRKIKEG